MKQNHQSKFSDADLIEAFGVNPHIGKLSVKFGVPHITIWRRAKKIGLQFSGCGNGIKVSLEEILDGKHPHYQTFKLKNRLLKEGLIENRCSECGISEWNGKPLSMQLDHIDGNSSNHKFENLRMICPNCHSQTETFCGKNK